jgi:phage tail tape-measure protein
MTGKTELFTAGVRAAAITAGAAAGGFAGKHIGGVAGSMVPIVGTYAGKVAGAYIGYAVGGCIGEAAGDTAAGFLLPVIRGAKSPSYKSVSIHSGYRPPDFFERIMHY